MSRLRMLTALLALCLFSGALPSGSIHAATGEPPVLSAAAQSAMDRGLAAAKQKKWDLAIKHFSEAQKEAPANPEALFNLALAYDSAKGRELLALCWFQAYLEAVPDAPNAEQVRKRISELEITVEDNLRKLAQTVEDTLAKLPDRFDTSGQEFRHYTFTVSTPKGFLKGKVPVTWARAGDINKAYQAAEVSAAESFPNSPKDQIQDKDYKYWEIAKAQAYAGDIEGARATAAKISPDSTWQIDEKMLADNERYGKCDPAYLWEYVARRFQTGTGADVTGSFASVAAADLTAFLSGLKGKSAGASVVQMIDAVKVLSEQFTFVRNCAVVKSRKEDPK